MARRQRLAGGRRARTQAGVALCLALVVPSGTRAASEATPALAAEPAYAVATTLDRAGRVLAPVTVNGHGPFRFIIDTGANRSVLSPALQQRLGLTFESGAAIAVHGVTGYAVLPAVRLDTLQAGAIMLARDTLVPVLQTTVLADADGILGVEGLDMARIDIDFDADSVRIAASNGRERAPYGFLTIPASLRHRGLLMVDARVGRVRAKAILDTGAERTLGNAALMEALKKSRREAAAEQFTTVFGATPETGAGTVVIAPTIYLGEAELRDLQVTFGNLYVFQVWDLEHEPALLIGMDLLGAVDRLIIDYRRREVQIKPRT